MVMKCVDIPEWLKGLPLAPEFRPTDTEFADPIAYISKIEKEASAFGICKVIPPLPKPSKKYVVHNLNNSLSKCPDLSSEVDSDAPSCKGNGEFRAVFTTRHQELGKSEKKKMKGGAVGGQPVGAQKQVWQSGEVYTLEQFEAKSKNFARSQLSMVKEVSPLAVEAMFWKAASEEPIYVEYANDVPGSAFGEPEGHVRYIHRRRRRQHKRTMVDRNSLGSCGNKNEVAISSSRVDNGPCGRVEAPSASLLTPSSNKSTNLSPFTSKGCSNAGEMEGSAGWKLANSPWNLQVIARSPGSLTRFMPDDIPGVTSPMVYIGMLFSWFAWHVEDHELHSLNFLHTGSPKTWYSVPGEYAFSFEEVTRRHAYGENIDRLAALTLLGEKTTLLSPEVVVASGIPCCRLVQNPGEFVVTFPRAYHVGFSHGFNCGEAANFGTPQWLAVAKEAAVRRAAMNYLPMLSHQQLLYLLTMSFVSSVPRTLLPGVRSSRLRDRQKEERELLVKKAFLEDIEKENNLVTVLLHKSFSGNAVLWDVDMLPPSGKESELHKHVSADASRRNDQSDNNDRQDLLDQMNLYMENYSDFYVDDDVSSEFQIDSGTLPCIACGILGFPFMALVQPSKKAAKHLFPEDFENKQDSGTLKHVESDSHSDPRGMIADCSRVDRIDRNGRNFLNHDEVSLSSQPCEPAVHLHECQASHHLSHTDNNALTSEELEKEWDVSRGFLRPRVLCLEHAIQTEELLNTKGGANVLVICHSDFQKMRAHATIVAEEIGTSFKYNDISLANASQGHLSLIDRAIEDEQEKCAEDWTLKLNINLRHCVKLQRNCPLKKLKHAVILAGLFSNSTPCTASSSLKWQSRKVRSRKKSNNSTESTPLAHAQTKKVIDLGSTVDRKNIRTGNITIQYSRKKYKFKACSSAEVNRVSADPLSVTSKEVSVADSKTLGASLLSDETAGSSSSAEGFVVASDGKPGLQHGHEMFALNRDQGNLLASQEVDLLAATSSMVEFDEAKAEICTSEKFALEDKTCDTNSNSCHTKHKSTAQETSGETEIAQVDISCTTISVVRSTANDDNLKDNRDMTECGIRNESAHPTEADFERRHRGEDDIMTRSPMPVNSSGSCTDGPSRSYSEQIEVSEQFGSGSEASDSGTLHNSEEQEIQNDIADKDIAVRDHVKLVKEAPVSAGSPKVMRETLNPKHSQSSDENLSERPKDESNNDTSSAIVSRPAAKSGGKRRRELDLLTDDGCSFGGFVKSPCEGLRPRIKKDVPVSRVDTKKPFEEKPRGKKEKRSLHSSITQKGKEEQGKGTHRCDLEGCRMSFQTKVDLRLHKRNRCPIEGCGKKFTSHKYALVHQRVHETDRPLKCPWKGCTMTFKWAWARTEHLRVHTGERPYKCKIESCGLTFRFVSDYSRHRRKTGHYVEAAN